MRGGLFLLPIGLRQKRAVGCHVTLGTKPLWCRGFLGSVVSTRACAPMSRVHPCRQQAQCPTCTSTVRTVSGTPDTGNRRRPKAATGYRITGPETW